MWKAGPGVAGNNAPENKEALDTAIHANVIAEPRALLLGQ
jgi:hypothetical protein